MKEARLVIYRLHELKMPRAFDKAKNYLESIERDCMDSWIDEAIQEKMAELDLENYEDLRYEYSYTTADGASFDYDDVLSNQTIYHKLTSRLNKKEIRMLDKLISNELFISFKKYHTRRAYAHKSDVNVSMYLEEVFSSLTDLENYEDFLYSKVVPLITSIYFEYCDELFEMIENHYTTDDEYIEMLAENQWFMIDGTPYDYDEKVNEGHWCLPGEAVCPTCGMIYHINCGCCNIKPVDEVI